VDWEQVAAFLADEGVPGIPDSIRAGEDESAAIAEISARLCYMSYGRGRRDIADFINNLLRFKDGSVFEHINYGFVFTGVSRSLTHELVRHRAGFAYSQRSQRYVDESGSRFVAPPVLADAADDEVQAVFEAAIESASKGYDELVRALESAIPRERFKLATDHRKAIRQAARAVLPNATETKIFVTANVRAWRHFIEMRAAPFADWEIRELAVAVLRVLQDEAPLLFGDFTIDRLQDGTEVASPEYSKV
jgi:thymidylate synthase (FAD)